MIFGLIAWLVVLVLGLFGAGIIFVSISDARHRRRLEEMKAEADLKRADYFVLSDKINDLPPTPAPKSRRGFL
jgi:phosphoserine phosphatase